MVAKVWGNRHGKVEFCCLQWLEPLLVHLFDNLVDVVLLVANAVIFQVLLLL